MHQLELSASAEAADHQETLRTGPNDLRVHPQIALWMVRGMLGAFIGTAALALLSDPKMRTPDKQPFHLALVRGSESVAPPTSVVSSPEPALNVANVPENVTQEAREADVRDSFAPVPATRHRVQRATPRNTNALALRPGKSYRPVRTFKRPFTAIVRGAKRAIRTVGSKLARLR